jgi:5-formyltetrahydrofolate cyclo-ligase
MAARRAAAPDRARHAADRFLEALGAEVAGRLVAGYWPMAGEIDPRPLLERLHALGIALALPVIEGSSLAFRAWHPGLAVRPGARGTSHPEAGDFVAPDVVIAPLVAFDRAGHRLGRGAGFYDRTIARLRAEGPVLVVGLAYDVQELDAVPIEPGDRRLDWVVTETRAMRFEGAGA